MLSDAASADRCFGAFRPSLALGTCQAETVKRAHCKLSFCNTPLLKSIFVISPTSLPESQ
jgi:hypothetical protein